MTKSHTNPSGTEEAQTRSPGITGEEARRHLLSGLPMAERRLSLNGVSTVVQEGGEGPPIVLLHGPGAYAATWFRIIPGLASSHRVIAPDLPSHGASGGFDTPDADRLTGWLDDLIECTCQEPPILVGHVLGGAIAARFAAERSDRLKRLILVDSLGLAPFRPAPEFGEALTGFLSDPTGASHDRLWARCTADLDAFRNGLGKHWASLRAYNLDRAQSPPAQAGVQAIMERFGFPEIPEENLARITIPTALIWGRHDLANPPAVAERAGARYGWPVHVIDGAADDPPLEQPKAFLQALQTILGDVQDPTTR